MSSGLAVSAACWVRRLPCHTKPFYLQSHTSFHKSRGHSWSKSRDIRTKKLLLAGFSLVLTHISFFLRSGPSQRMSPGQIFRKDRLQSDQMERRRLIIPKRPCGKLLACSCRSQLVPLFHAVQARVSPKKLAYICLCSFFLPYMLLSKAFR